MLADFLDNIPIAAIYSSLVSNQTRLISLTK